MRILFRAIGGVCLAATFFVLCITLFTANEPMNAGHGLVCFIGTITAVLYFVIGNLNDSPTYSDDLLDDAFADEQKVKALYEYYAQEKARLDQQVENARQYVANKYKQ